MINIFECGNMFNSINYLVDIQLIKAAQDSLRLGIRIYKNFVKNNIDEQIKDAISNFFDSDLDIGLGKLNKMDASIIAVKKVSKNYFEKNNIFPYIIIGEPDEKEVKRVQALGKLRSFDVRMTEKIVTSMDDDAI